VPEGVPGCGPTGLYQPKGSVADWAAKPQGRFFVAVTAEHQPTLAGKVCARTQLWTVALDQHAIDGYFQLKSQKKQHENPPPTLCFP
jgi:hypothetical protein